MPAGQRGASGGRRAALGGRCAGGRRGDATRGRRGAGRARAPAPRPRKNDRAADGRDGRDAERDEEPHLAASRGCRRSWSWRARGAVGRRRRRPGRGYGRERRPSAARSRRGLVTRRGCAPADGSVIPRIGAMRSAWRSAFQNSPAVCQRSRRLDRRAPCAKTASTSSLTVDARASAASGAASGVRRGDGELHEVVALERLLARSPARRR